MALLDSKEWKAILAFIDRFFFLFVENDYNNYVLVETKTYKLSLSTEQIVLMLEWIRRMFFMMGMNPPEMQRLSDAGEIKKIVNRSLKYARDNKGMFSWSPPTELKSLKNNLEALLNNYTGGNSNCYEELAKSFDAYFNMVLRSSLNKL